MAELDLDKYKIAYEQWRSGREECDYDTALLCHAVPKLIAEVERLRKEVAELRQLIPGGNAELVKSMQSRDVGIVALKEMTAELSRCATLLEKLR